MRFPPSSVKCDLLDTHPDLQHRIPVLVEVKSGIPQADRCPIPNDEDAARGMRFRRWKDRPHSHGSLDYLHYLSYQLLLYQCPICPSS